MNKQKIIVRRTGQDRHMDELEKQILNLQERCENLCKILDNVCDERNAYRDHCQTEHQQGACLECPVHQCPKNWYYTRGYGPCCPFNGLDGASTNMIVVDDPLGGRAMIHGQGKMETTKARRPDLDDHCWHYPEAGTMTKLANIDEWHDIDPALRTELNKPINFKEILKKQYRDGDVVQWEDGFYYKLDEKAMRWNRVRAMRWNRVNPREGV